METRVGTEAIEESVALDRHHQPVTPVNSPIEPLEGEVDLAEADVGPGKGRLVPRSECSGQTGRRGRYLGSTGAFRGRVGEPIGRMSRSFYPGLSAPGHIDDSEETH
jgi:hypothetical protein